MVEVGARRNGFHFPTNTFQVLSWVLYIGFLASFYALFFLYTDTVGRAVWGTFFGLFAFLTGASAILATAKDPADPGIYDASAGRQDPLAVLPGKLYCYRCRAHVSDESKHCIVCKKCVHRFDHHCVWLNSCVGSRTYRYFFSLLANASVMLGILIALTIYLIVQYGSNTTLFDLTVRDNAYSGLSGGAFFGLAVFVLVVTVVVEALVLQLFSFHCYLVHAGLTTYDYVFNKRFREEQRYAGFASASSSHNLHSASQSHLQRPQQHLQMQPISGGTGTTAANVTTTAATALPSYAAYPGSSSAGGSVTYQRSKSRASPGSEPQPSAASGLSGAGSSSSGGGASAVVAETAEDDDDAAAGNEGGPSVPTSTSLKEDRLVGDLSGGAALAISGPEAVAVTVEDPASSLRPALSVKPKDSSEEDAISDEDGQGSVLRPPLSVAVSVPEVSSTAAATSFLTAPSEAEHHAEQHLPVSSSVPGPVPSALVAGPLATAPSSASLPPAVSAAAPPHPPLLSPESGSDEERTDKDEDDDEDETESAEERRNAKELALPASE